MQFDHLSVLFLFIYLFVLFLIAILVMLCAMPYHIKKKKVSFVDRRCIVFIQSSWSEVRQVSEGVPRPFLIC